MSRRQLLRLAQSATCDTAPASSAPRYRSIRTSAAQRHEQEPFSRQATPFRSITPLSKPSQGSTSRRHTSFWTQSYPPPRPSAIPYAPPSPDELAHQNQNSDGDASDPTSLPGPASTSPSTSRLPSASTNAKSGKARGIRASVFGYGSNVTFAGHGQNVHVLDGDDPRPSAWSASASAGGPDSMVGAELAGQGGASAEVGMGPGQGRRRERKNRYLDSLMDKAGEMNLRCSVLDADGEWTLQEGRFKKAELCKEYDLDPRDLRKLDSLAPNLVPIILTRKTCILMSILHVRALIKPDKVIIFDVPGVEESEAQRRFKLHLERNVKAGQAAEGQTRALLGLKGPGPDGAVDAIPWASPTGTVERNDRAMSEEAEEDDADVLPYEHRALESILVATANALEEEMAYTRSLVRHLLADLEDDINRENLKKLLHYSRRMVGFQSRARYIKRAVDEILDNDEDLSAMYLTSTSLGRPRALHDHEQLELLLESFTKQVEEIVSEIDNTVANIQSTQEIAELMLDSGRNALLALDIKISFATLGAGCAAVVAGVFGMNLTSNLESSPYAFLIATASAGMFGLFIFVYGLRHLRRVRRVALSDRPRGKRSPSHYMPTDDPSKLTWDHLPPIDPLTGTSRRVDRELMRRTRAADKRKIWDMISRSKSASSLSGGQAAARGGVSVSAGMAAWKTAQIEAIRKAHGAQYQRHQHHVQHQHQPRHGHHSESTMAITTEGVDPVYMHYQADQARARDAWLAVQKDRQKGSGREAGSCGSDRDEAWLGQAAPWETAPWKWGRGKAKWSKE